MGKTDENALKFLIFLIPKNQEKRQKPDLNGTGEENKQSKEHKRVVPRHFTRKGS